MMINYIGSRNSSLKPIKEENTHGARSVVMSGRSGRSNRRLKFERPSILDMINGPKFEISWKHNFILEWLNTLLGIEYYK